MGAHRALMEDAVRNLAAIERGSASPGEREAAEWIAARLRELGCEARVEPESAHGGFWGPLGLANGVVYMPDGNSGGFGSGTSGDLIAWSL